MIIQNDLNSLSNKLKKIISLKLSTISQKQPIFEIEITHTLIYLLFYVAYKKHIFF